jgi:hypothetical protein
MRQPALEGKEERKKERKKEKIMGKGVFVSE